MKTGKYTLREFFGNTDLNTIIIPEIQRDYVWRKEQVEKLLESIWNDYTDFSSPEKLKSISCSENDKEIEIEFEKYYKKNYLSSNIGFIYAYSDADYSGSYFLIDGQQRFTTIFITLLVMVANGNNDIITNFKRTYTNNDLLYLQPKIDYRVREASHNFLCKLVQSIDSAKSELSSNWIKEQSWYLQDYDNDTTIDSIIDNIEVIAKFLKEKKIIQDSNDSIYRSFLEYIQEYLEFWYFDTNISEQGEELYIYMNARGEFMQAHENLKADLIGKLTTSQDKKTYGEKWEEWQDLFWRNRMNNSNADKGFNEFLCCIAGLENYLLTEDKRLPFTATRDDITYDYKKTRLSMAVIERYYNAASYLFSDEKIKAFSDNYSYSDWIGKAKDVFWEIINGKETNWFANPKDDNKGVERNRMVYIWSMLRYLSLIDKTAGSPDNVYRTLRLFYVRYNNYDRTVVETLKNILTIVGNGPWDASILKDEESKKYSYLTNNIKDVESWIWKIEDHPLNLDGSYVGNINCSHLVNFDKNPDAAALQNIYETFCGIFPIDNDGKSDNNAALFNSLLFTSLDNDFCAFWDIDGPGYYTRLNFSSFRKIIRGKTNHGENEIFKIFFQECLTSRRTINKMKTTKDVEDVMNDIGMTKNSIDGNNTIIFALCWYAAKYGQEIWKKGAYMSFNHQYENQAYKNDSQFPNITSLTNMRGDFKNSKGYQYLQEL